MLQPCFLTPALPLPGAGWVVEFVQQGEQAGRHLDQIAARAQVDRHRDAFRHVGAEGARGPIKAANSSAVMPPRRNGTGRRPDKSTTVDSRPVAT
jgi:hypothetical protein